MGDHRLYFNNRGDNLCCIRVIINDPVQGLIAWYRLELPA